MTTISTLPEAPSPTDTQTAFNTKAFALLAALAQFVTQTNAVAGEVASGSATATSKASEASNSATAAASSSSTATTAKNSAVSANDAAQAALTAIQNLINSTGQVWSGGTFTGATTFQQTVDTTQTTLSLGATKEKKVSLTASTATTTIDLSAADIFIVTVSANTTLSFTNAPTDGSVKSFTIFTVNDGTAGRALAFPSSVSFAGGILPPRTTAANGKDAWSFISTNGTSFTGSLSVQNY